MNSLPLISHHLFVEAIGNAERNQQRPRRPEKPFPEITRHSPNTLLDALDGAKPLTQDETRMLRTAAPQVRA